MSLADIFKRKPKQLDAEPEDGESTDMMDGNEAHAIGLIHYLVSEDQVMAKAKEVAHALAQKPPIAMKLNKRRFREITQPAFEEACRTGGQVQKQAFAAGEPQASMKKFFEERARRKSAT